MSNILTLTNSTIEQDAQAITNAITEGIKNGSKNAVELECKQAMSPKMTQVLSEAYGVKMTATNMKKRYSGNVAYYMEKITELDKLDNPTEEQVAKLQEYRTELGKSQARWAFWYNATKADYKKESLMRDEELYKAYEAKRENGTVYRAMLADYFEANYDMKVKNATIEYINDTIGRKRAAITEANECQTKAFNISEYFMFLTDTMIELAIAKKQMNIGKACEVVQGKLEHIEDFDNIIVVEKRTDKTTVAQMKETLTSVGVVVSSKDKKSDLIKKWNKAKKEGLFAEYTPYYN